MAAALHLGIVALHRSKVEVLAVGTRVHARGCAAAEADEHGRPPELNDAIARRRSFLFHVRGVDEADATGDHDRFVIAAPHPSAVVFQGAEHPQDVGPTEFIAKSRAADRPFGHNGERGCQAVRESSSFFFPRLGKLRQAQMRGEKGTQARLRPTARARRPLVADLPPDSSGGSGIGRNGSRMIVGLDLDQDVGLPLAVAIAKILV